MAGQLKDVRGSLSDFSDDELFYRLFYQRNKPDSDLIRSAEVLSLVYSFSIESVSNPNSELNTLGELVELTGLELYRSSQIFQKRQIIQARGNMRAILPTPIANRLAVDALNHIPVTEIIQTLESKTPRLLTSFSRRLGYLHNNEISKQIVSSWLKPNGILYDLSKFSDNHFTDI